LFNVGSTSMLKRCTQIVAFVLLSSTAALSFANTTIENAQMCAMKNLNVNCEKGDQIKLDVIRTHDTRGDIFLNINSGDALGDYILLYINNNKPEVLKMQKSVSPATPSAKGAFIPRSIISKLRTASSVHFKIAKQKGSPISGSLGQYHFEWLKRFGAACS